MIKIGSYYIGEERLAQVVGEGKPLSEAYPNLPADILSELQEEATRRFGKQPKKKKKPKKLNHD